MPPGEPLAVIAAAEHVLEFIADKLKVEARVCLASSKTGSLLRARGIDRACVSCAHCCRDLLRSLAGYIAAPVSLALALACMPVTVLPCSTRSPRPI